MLVYIVDVAAGSRGFDNYTYNNMVNVNKTIEILKK